MKMRPECVPCVTRRILMEINEVDPSRGMEIMVECVKVLAQGIYDGVASSECATRVHRRAYDMLGTDPYLALKERSNRQALALYPRAREYVEGADDPFRAAVMCSIVGNVLDYGIDPALDRPDYLLNSFESLLEEGLAVDHTGRIREIISGAERVTFLPDNAGEIVFDQILLEQIRALGPEITLVVKGEPILTDVTMKEVKELGLDRLADRVITTGGFAVGFPFWDMGQELESALEGADIIVSKGMGNFECLTELDYSPVAYLMRAKCQPVADAAGVPVRSSVAILSGTGGQAMRNKH